MMSWVYTLPKERLIHVVAMYELDKSGTLDELRKRMVQFIDEHPEQFPSTSTIPPLATTESRRESRLTVVPGAIPPEFGNGRGTIDADILNQIRKWGCHFDGRDPVAFLERVDELRAGYGYSDEQLLRGLPELLRGDALLWARNTRDDWDTWERFRDDFKSQYFPPQYRKKLQREIFERRQKEHEKFATYSSQMMTMMRRAGGFTRDQQLTRIHANMRPLYKRHVRRSDVFSLSELLSRVSELEAIDQEEREEKAERKNTASRPIVAMAYNKEEHCWKCKQRGHTRFTCQRPARRFCSQCGKDGVLTKECHPRQGNEQGAGTRAGEANATQ